MTSKTMPARTLPLPDLAAEFLLDPDIVFLNHGSYGACSRPVFEAYQQRQRELERDPVDFIGRRTYDLIVASRTELAGYVGTTPEKLVFVPNATYGINVVARSLDLEPGDEILTTDHEYGAVNNTWRFNCQQTGAIYVNWPIPLPMTTPEEFVDRLWEGVTPRTKVITFSHITSPTALIFPAELICARARAEGITTVIDGAHAPGQIDLDLDGMGVDYYTGNCHKWLSSPKGAGFLYAAEQRKEFLEPLVVSHGWTNGRTGSKFLDNFTWTGTMDPAAYLSVGDAVRFQRKHDWPSVRAACHALASEARNRLNDLTGLESICPDSTTWFSQMVTVRLPREAIDRIRDGLWPDYRIEVPVFPWQDEGFIRISIQAYNTPEHVDYLIDAIRRLMA